MLDHMHKIYNLQKKMKSYKCKIMLKSNLNINCLSINKYILSEFSIKFDIWHTTSEYNLHASSSNRTYVKLLTCLFVHYTVNKGRLITRISSWCSENPNSIIFDMLPDVSLSLEVFDSYMK